MKDLLSRSLFRLLSPEKANGLWHPALIIQYLKDPDTPKPNMDLEEKSVISDLPKSRLTNQEKN